MQSLIYLIRHGEIDRYSPRRFLGQSNVPLNAYGIEQAKALGRQVHRIPFTRVFTSPLQRAVQTASLVSGRPADALYRIDAFKEIDLGAWEGLSVAEVKDRFPGAYEQRGRDLEHFRPENGESFSDLAARCYPALLELATTCPGPLLVVGHAGVNRVLLSRIGNQPLQQLLDIPQDYCAVNILRWCAQQWNVEAINLHTVQ